MVNHSLESSTEIRNSSTGGWQDQSKVNKVKGFDGFVTIDWMEDTYQEHERQELKNRDLKSSTSLAYKVISLSQSWLILALIGFIIGIIAGSINIITAWLSSIRLGRCSHTFYLSRSFCCRGLEEVCDDWIKWSSFELFNYIIYIGFALVFAGFATKLVQVYAPYATGSGISEIKCIVSGFVVPNFLGWSTLIIKSIALPLAIGSGLSVGKEGPSVHYAVSVGNSIAKSVSKYRNSASKGREFLTAASAAGVAVAFGSPMGGVLFSIEEISSVFHLPTISKSYFCSLVAVTTLRMMNPFRNGQLVLFEVTYDTNWHYFEIPMYIFIGIFGGTYGILVSKLNIRVVSFRKRYLHKSATVEVILLALLTASISYFNEFLRVDMTESMQILFHECNESFKHHICNRESGNVVTLISLIIATVIRTIFIIFTYGCKVPAGIFVPSMAVGATFGRALGIFTEDFQNKFSGSFLFNTCSEKSHCIIPGTYAFLGAAAALSGITDLTVTVVIIMFELTGALRYMVPTMIVVAVTKTINDKFGKGGIADQMIKFNGLPYIESETSVDMNLPVLNAMTRNITFFSVQEDEELTVAELRKILHETVFSGFPVVKSFKNPIILGYINRVSLISALENMASLDNSTICKFGLLTSDDHCVNLQEYVNFHPFIVGTDVDLKFVRDIFLKLGPSYILVEEKGRLVGLLSRKDIIRYEYTYEELHLDPNFHLKRQKEQEIDELIWKRIYLLYDKSHSFFSKLISRGRRG